MTMNYSRQSGPPGYYLASFLVFFLPYFFVVPHSIVKSVTWIKNRDENYLLIGCWFVSGWLLYEFISSKLPSYVAMSYIPLSLLISKELYSIKEGFFHKTSYKITSGFHLIFSIALSGIFLILPLFIELKSSFIFVIVGICYIAGTVTAFYYAKNNLLLKSKISFIINASVFLLLVWGILIPLNDNLKSGTKSVAIYLNEHTKETSTIAISNKNGSPPSLPFYLSKYFSEITEDYESESIYKIYSSREPVAFILNQQLVEKLRVLKPEMTFHTISAFHTDRISPVTYFILINEAALK
jgi:4-amino-4-deoxy-L-arabinose transferase-like glycosyltransferase